MPSTRSLLAALFALGAIAGLLRADVRNTNKRGGAWPQRAYVWQRTWTPALQASLAELALEFAALEVLAAEISWRDGAPVVYRPEVAWPALKATGRPVGVIVRIGPSAGFWTPEAPATRAVTATCREVLAQARAAGVEPVELQLDFDAATARLDAYRTLLRIIRREVGPPRLVITTLPDWLRSGDFDALIRETDAYVLQVHSLEKPRTIRDSYTLCDPARAARWVAEASRRAHPFRVALPSYGYRVWFDAAGIFAALEAEAPARPWPVDHQLRVVLANPEEIAALVQQLLASPPPHCEGLVWFRFPQPHDELAWSWPTLRAAMRGQLPLTRLALTARPGPNGVLELILANQGETSVEPAAFRVAWRHARVLAADALAGWRIEREGASALVVRPPPYGSNGLLRPGDTLQVGWLRLDSAVPLSIESAP